MFAYAVLHALLPVCALNLADPECRRLANPASCEDPVPALIPVLATNDKGQCRIAIRKLGNLGPEAEKAILALLRALADLELRCDANDALVRVGPASAPFLYKLAANPKEKVWLRSFALQCLQDLGKGASDTVTGLITLLNDPEVDIVYHAAAALGATQDRKAMRELRRMGEDSDAATRLIAIHGLSYSGSKSAIRLLHRIALEDNAEFYLRIEAIQSLGRFRSQSEEAVATLVSILKKDVQQREPSGFALPVFTALSSLGGPAIPGLVRLLEDREIPVEVRGRILITFNSIPPSEHATLSDKQIKHAIAALAEALKDPEELNRLQAAAAMGLFFDRGKMGYDALKAFVLKGSAAEQARGAQALARITKGDDFTLRLLLKLLRDESRVIRQEAAGGLELCSPKAEIAIPALLKASQTDEDAHVRQAVVSALARTRSEKALPGLIRALEDEDASVRRQAAASLHRFPGALAAMKALIRATHDQDESVRSFAKATLMALPLPLPH